VNKCSLHLYDLHYFRCTPGTGDRGPGTGNRGPGTGNRNPIPDTRNPKPVTRNPKPETHEKQILSRWRTNFNYHRSTLAPSRIKHSPTEYNFIIPNFSYHDWTIDFGSSKIQK